MKISIIPLLISFLAAAGEHGCSVKTDSDHMLFTFKDVSYQSWVYSEKERGTEVTIILKNADPEVEFDSLTFRGMQVPVQTSQIKGRTILKARFITGEPILDDYEYIATEEEDCLKYRYRSQDYLYPLRNIKRLPTRIK